MKLKLLKEFTQGEQVYPVGSVIDIEDQAACDQLMADGTAETYTDDMAAQDQAAVEQNTTTGCCPHANRSRVFSQSSFLSHLQYASTQVPYQLLFVTPFLYALI